ncbi:MAG: hypothetical protein ACYDAQ_20690, partial [Mycobacteriales bacterium]
MRLGRRHRRPPADASARLAQLAGGSGLPLTALVREVAEFRLALETDLTIAAAAVEADRPRLAAQLLDGERGELERFEDRMLGRLADAPPGAHAPPGAQAPPARHPPSHRHTRPATRPATWPATRPATRPATWPARVTRHLRRPPATQVRRRPTGRRGATLLATAAGLAGLLLGLALRAPVRTVGISDAALAE